MTTAQHVRGTDWHRFMPRERVSTPGYEQLMAETPGIVCRRCGTETEAEEIGVFHPDSAPLVVSECPRCGSILGIGGHRW